MKFQTKLIIAILGILLAVQLATLTSVLTTTQLSVNEELEQQLQLAGNVFEQLMETRSEQLFNSASVLVSDFGFKSAAATRDSKTIQSVLANHGARVDADIVSLIDLDGVQLASSEISENLNDTAIYQQLISLAEPNGYLITNLIVDRQPFQAVVVSVDAPNRIAWALLAFSLDNNLAMQLKELTGLEVSFVSAENTGDEFVTSTMASIQSLEDLSPVGFTEEQFLAPSIWQTNNVEHLSLVLRLQSNTGQLSAVLQRPLLEAMQGFYQLRFDILLMTLVATLLAVALAIFIARSVSKPIKIFSSATQRVALGDYEARVDLNTNDEFGDLAAAFNKMQEDVSVREQKISRDAHYDQLTQLPNRVLVIDRLATAIDRAERSGSQILVVAIDIDRFTEINTSLGSNTGDQVLIALAKRMVSNVRKSDTVAKVGTKDFVLILEQLERDSGFHVIEKMVDELQKVVAVGSIKLSVGFHCGMTTYPDQGRTGDELIKRANIAMQDARANRVAIQEYREGQDDEYNRRLTILTDIKRAVENDEFTLVYQPKIGIANRHVVECEALIRWIHPEQGFLPPDEFISLAEKFGIISLITKWVVNEVIKQIERWESAGLSMKVGINLSALDVKDQEFPQYVASLLNKHRVPASNLVMEITESAFVQDAEIAKAVLNQFRKMGMCIAIDDYGTGYSSLSQIRDLPVTELKIDRSFIMNLEPECSDAVIVQSTIDMGHNMGLSVTAEGVETIEGVEILESFGCDTLQGYYFSKPISADEFLPWVNAFHARPEYQATASSELVSRTH